MKLSTLSAIVLAAATSTTAFAADPVNTASKAGPVQMSEAQLDMVAAGALINVIAVDVVDVQNVLNNNKVAVQVPVNAAVAAGVLGNAGAIAFQGQPGRIKQ